MIFKSDWLVTTDYALCWWWCGWMLSWPTSSLTIYFRFNSLNVTYSFMIILWSIVNCVYCDYVQQERCMVGVCCVAQVSLLTKWPPLNHSFKWISCFAGYAYCMYIVYVICKLQLQLQYIHQPLLYSIQLMLLLILHLFD